MSGYRWAAVHFAPYIHSVYLPNSPGTVYSVYSPYSPGIIYSVYSPNSAVNYLLSILAELTRNSLSVSRALVASSSRRILGLRIKARAMAILCFWPPESWVPFSPVSKRKGQQCFVHWFLLFFFKHIIEHAKRVSLFSSFKARSERTIYWYCSSVSFSPLREHLSLLLHTLWCGSRNNVYVC